MNTRVEGGSVRITVTAHATLSAGPLCLTLVAREGPTPGTWHYGVTDSAVRRPQYGQVAAMTSHLDVLRYAAAVCAAGCQPGTIERRLLVFAATGEHQRTDLWENHEQ
jgi:hypothetical protein